MWTFSVMLNGVPIFFESYDQPRPTSGPPCNHSGTPQEPLKKCGGKKTNFQRNIYIDSSNRFQKKNRTLEMVKEPTIKFRVVFMIYDIILY